MRGEEEIRKEKIRCLNIEVAKMKDEKGGYKGKYYAGASNALRWVLEELDTV